MATSITSTYAGQAAQGYVTAALLSGDTLANNNVTILPNVDRYKTVIRKLDTSGNIIQNAACDFTDSGTVTITEKVLTLEQFMVNKEECKSSFIDAWSSAQLGRSAHNTNGVPAEFQSAIVDHYIKLVAQGMEISIWRGANASAGQFDGFEVLFAADSDVVDIASPVALTAANVISKIGEVYAAVPAALINSPELRIYINKKTYSLYQQALGAVGSGVGYSNLATVGEKPLDYLGVPIVVAPGMSDDTIIAAERTNLFFGTSLLSDHNEVRIVDMSETAASDNVRFVMRFNAGIQYAYGAEVVMYKA